MVQGCRAGTLPLLGIIVLCGVAALFVFAPPAGAFFELHIDGRFVDATPALHPMDSGVGIALSLLGPEFGFLVDDGAWPEVELRLGSRWARIVVGDAHALVDGRTVVLSAAPRVHEDELFVPLTLVSELTRMRMQVDVAQGVLALTSRARREEGSGGDATAPKPVEGAAESGARAAPSTEPRREPPSAVDAILEAFLAASRMSGDEQPGPGSVEEAADVEEAVGSAADTDAAPARGGRDGAMDVISEVPAAPEGAASDPGAGRGAVTEGDGPSLRPPLVVQDVQVVHRDGNVHIEVFVDGDVEPRVMFLDDPARLVVDMDDAVAATGWRVAPGDGRIVEQVRVHGADGTGVRIVADLTGPTGYALSALDAEGGFVLRLNHQLRLVHAEVTESGTVELQMRVTGPVPYRVFPLQQPDRLVIDMFGVSVPGAADVPLSGGWATHFRLSQFEQAAVRGVFVLADDEKPAVHAEEGVLRPGPDGIVRLSMDAAGLGATEPEVDAGRTNTLQFVGFGQSDDLEYILIETAEPMDVDVLRLRGPDRVVVDMPGLSVERSLGLIPGESAIVKALRAGQADDAAGRIVAETFGVAEHYLLLSPDRTRAVLALRPSGLAGRTVVVDAGHGGRDPGAIGHSGSYEKDVTLAIALRVADLLGRAGADVVLTRDDDRELTLSERAQLANAIGADAFVSIHADAIGFGRVASGTSTFYHPEAGSDAEASINRQYAATLQTELLRGLGLPDRGVHQRAFHVVLNTKMPSALVEVGFIDNPDEEKLLLDPMFQARAAAAISDGIVRFFGEQRAQNSEQVRQWHARTGRATGLWIVLGIVPAGVTALEPAPLFAAFQAESRPAAQPPDVDVSLSPRFPGL